MKILGIKYNKYSRKITDIIYIKGDRICWLMKSWTIDPDTMWSANKSIITGHKFNTWEDLVSLIASKSKEGYGYMSIAD